MHILKDILSKSDETALKNQNYSKIRKYPIPAQKMAYEPELDKICFFKSSKSLNHFPGVFLCFLSDE